MTNEHFHKNFEKVGSKLKNRISKNKQVRSEYRNWRKTYEKHVKHEENKKRENYEKMWRRTHKRTHSEHANEKQRKMCKKTSTDTGVIWNMLHNYGRNLEKYKEIKKNQKNCYGYAEKTWKLLKPTNLTFHKNQEKLSGNAPKKKIRKLQLFFLSQCFFLVW